MFPLTNEFLGCRITLMKDLKWTLQEDCFLNVFLRTKIPEIFSGKEISNGKIRRLIVAGAVKVDGRQCRIASFIVKKGSEVEALIDEKKFFYEKDPGDIDFTLEQKDVLFEDESIIVVNKPPFIPTEETVVKSRRSMHQAVVEYLWKKNPTLRNPPYAGIMHRLDRETSGTLLFTKTRAVNAKVHDMFEDHTAQKKYRAVCFSSKPESVKESFSVENYIGRISPKSAKCKIGILPEEKGGQYARTDFFVAGKKGGFIYVDCILHTGRTHQIRVHLSSAGLPVVGDGLYGGIRGFSENNGRIMLHAVSLAFPHPVTGEIITVEAPMDSLFSR